MTAPVRDRLGSSILLAFVGALWVQRDYITPFGGLFPDVVMVILAAILVVSLALSFRRPRSPATGERTDAAEPLRWKDMAVVGAILLAWALLLRPLGFAVVGIAAFSAISAYLARPPRGLPVIGRSVLVAVAVTVVLMLVFGWLLKVPLPSGTLFS